MIAHIAHAILVYPHVVFLLTSVHKCAVFPDFSTGGVRKRPNVPHLDHRPREALKEGVLAACEPIDNWRRRRQRTWG
jgi:hypothetical protein